MTGNTATINFRSGYTSIPNKAMSDCRLSIEARGLLALLMTFGHGWVFRPSHLMKQCGVGRDKYFRMSKELQNLGYLIITPKRDDQGKFDGSDWTIIPDPRDDPGVCEYHNPENTESGDPDPLSINNKISDNNYKDSPHTPQGGAVVEQSPTLLQCEPSPSKQKKISKAPKGGLRPGCETLDDEFEFVWPAYRKIRGVGKGAARKAWAKARLKVSFETIAGPLREHIRIQRRNPDTSKIPHFSTWLNREGWEDDPRHASNAPATTDDQLDALNAPTTDDQLDNLFPENQLRLIK